MAHCGPNTRHLTTPADTYQIRPTPSVTAAAIVCMKPLNQLSAVRLLASLAPMRQTSDLALHCLKTITFVLFISVVRQRLLCSFLTLVNVSPVWSCVANFKNVNMFSGWNTYWKRSYNYTSHWFAVKVVMCELKALMRQTCIMFLFDDFATFLMAMGIIYVL